MRQGKVNGGVQLFWPPGSPPWLRVRHNIEVQGGKVVAIRQRSDFCLFNLTNNLTMCAYEAPDRRVGEEIVIVGVPAEQVGDGDERQLLGQQTGPFLETARNDDAMVRRQGSVAGDHVGLRRRVRTDLAGEGQGAEAARDGDGLMAVRVHHLRGKKPAGAGPSGGYR